MERQVGVCSRLTHRKIERSRSGSKLKRSELIRESTPGCMSQHHKAQRSPLRTYASLKNITSHVETLKPQIVVAEVQTHHRNAVTTHKHRSHRRSLLRARHRHSLHGRYYASRYPIANLNCGNYLPKRRIWRLPWSANTHARRK